MLMIGPYDLLIADACSGLNSMIALAGIGLIYTYVVSVRFGWRSALLLLSVLPIAFTANVIRVVLLLLITYHAGDDAGRAFHSWAAYLEIALAFTSLFAIDLLIPDLIPFADEILLGLAAVLLGKLKRAPDGERAG